MRFRLQDMKRKIWAVGVGLAVTFFHLYWMNTSNQFLIEIRQRMDWIIYDMRLFYNLEDNPEPSADIVLIDMDEKSLSEQGRWPWSRLIMADLINKLGEAGVAVTAIDVSFPEPETNPAAQVIRYLKDNNATDQQIRFLDEASKALDADGALTESVKSHDVVPGYIFINDGDSKGAIPPPLVTDSTVPAKAWGIQSARGFISNIPQVTEAAAGSGFYSVLEDDDGTLRRYNMLFEHEGEIYSSLALEALRLYLFADGVEILGTEDASGLAALEGVRLADLELPLDQYGRMLIPFKGRSGQFPTVSATDVIEGRVDPSELEGKIAFIGSTAKALFDFRSTPVQSQFPGLEVHPTIAQGILDQNIKHQPWWGYGINILLILITGILFSLILPFLSAPVVLGISLVYLISYALLNNWLWTVGISIDSVVVISLVLMQSLGVFIYGFISERFARLQVTDMFGQYVPPELVSQMSDEPKHALSFDGDRRDMTVLFADIRNFTSISEGMEPAELKDMLNRYFTPMTKIIFDNQGTIDKYIGDLVMAFWGAPLDDPDHSVNALKAAMEMLEETQRLKSKFNAMGYPDIEIGIGLNSGEMNVGNMGSEYRRSYTVLGDNVNLGSRIEGLTKFYGAKLLVGENTYHRCKDQFQFCPVDKVLVKGKEEPVMLYEPLGKQGEVDPETLFEMESYEEALEAYYQGYWEDAHRQFFILNKLNPDRGLYKVYAERTSGEHEPPPEGWDGVFRHTSK